MSSCENITEPLPEHVDPSGFARDHLLTLASRAPVPIGPFLLGSTFHRPVPQRSEPFKTLLHMRQELACGRRLNARRLFRELRSTSSTEEWAEYIDTICKKGYLSVFLEAVTNAGYTRPAAAIAAASTPDPVIEGLALPLIILRIDAITLLTGEADLMHSCKLDGASRASALSTSFDKTRWLLRGSMRDHAHLASYLIYLWAGDCSLSLDDTVLVIKAAFDCVELSLSEESLHNFAAGMVLRRQSGSARDSELAALLYMYVEDGCERHNHPASPILDEYAGFYMRLAISVGDISLALGFLTWESVKANSSIFKGAKLPALLIPLLGALARARCFIAFMKLGVLPMLTHTPLLSIPEEAFCLIYQTLASAGMYKTLLAVHKFMVSRGQSLQAELFLSLVGAGTSPECHVVAEELLNMHPHLRSSVQLRKYLTGASRKFLSIDLMVERVREFTAAVVSVSNGTLNPGLQPSPSNFTSTALGLSRLGNAWGITLLLCPILGDIIATRINPSTFEIRLPLRHSIKNLSHFQTTIPSTDPLAQRYSEKMRSTLYRSALQQLIPMYDEEMFQIGVNWLVRTAADFLHLGEPIYKGVVSGSVDIADLDFLGLASLLAYTSSITPPRVKNPNMTYLKHDPACWTDFQTLAEGIQISGMLNFTKRTPVFCAILTVIQEFPIYTHLVGNDRDIPTAFENIRVASTEQFSYLRDAIPRNDNIRNLVIDATTRTIPPLNVIPIGHRRIDTPQSAALRALEYLRTDSHTSVALSNMAPRRRLFGPVTTSVAPCSASKQQLAAAAKENSRHLDPSLSNTAHYMQDPRGIYSHTKPNLIGGLPRKHRRLAQDVDSDPLPLPWSIHPDADAPGMRTLSAARCAMAPHDRRGPSRWFDHAKDRNNEAMFAALRTAMQPVCADADVAKQAGVLRGVIKRERPPLSLLNPAVLKKGISRVPNLIYRAALVR